MANNWTSLIVGNESDSFALLPSCYQFPIQALRSIKIIRGTKIGQLIWFDSSMRDRARDWAARLVVGIVVELPGKMMEAMTTTRRGERGREGERDGLTREEEEEAERGISGDLYQRRCPCVQRVAEGL